MKISTGKNVRYKFKIKIPKFIQEMRQIIKEIMYTQTDSNQIQYDVSYSARRGHSEVAGT